jgi:hypothetical protein
MLITETAIFKARNGRTLGQWVRVSFWDIYDSLRVFWASPVLCRKRPCEGPIPHVRNLTNDLKDYYVQNLIVYFNMLDFLISE